MPNDPFGPAKKLLDKLKELKQLEEYALPKENLHDQGINLLLSILRAKGDIEVQKGDDRNSLKIIVKKQAELEKISWDEILKKSQQMDAKLDELTPKIKPVTFELQNGRQVPKEKGTIGNGSVWENQKATKSKLGTAGTKWVNWFIQVSGWSYQCSTKDSIVVRIKENMLDKFLALNPDGQALETGDQENGRPKFSMFSPPLSKQEMKDLLEPESKEASEADDEIASGVEVSVEVPGLVPAV